MLLKENLKNLENKVNLEDRSNNDLKSKIETIETENQKLKYEIQEMEKELEISRYKLIKAEEKKSEVSKKIDELTREADSFEDGQEW